MSSGEGSAGSKRSPGEVGAGGKRPRLESSVDFTSETVMESLAGQAAGSRDETPGTMEVAGNDHVMFGGPPPDPESVRDLYNAVLAGEYDSAPVSTFAQRVRIEVVKIIESTPVKSVRDRDIEFRLGETNVLYRGMNFRSEKHFNDFRADKEPWNPYNDGAPKDEDPEKGLSGGETFFGMYVTIDPLQARGYSEQGDPPISVVFTFSWPVIRAMYVCGFIDFVTSNDAALKTEEFGDEDEMSELIDDVKYFLGDNPYGEASDSEETDEDFGGEEKPKIPEDVKVAIVGDDAMELAERIQDMPSSVIWAALMGRNRELAITGGVTEYPKEGFDWKSPFGDAVIVGMDMNP